MKTEIFYSFTRIGIQTEIDHYINGRKEEFKKGKHQLLDSESFFSLKFSHPNAIFVFMV